MWELGRTGDGEKEEGMQTTRYVWMKREKDG
jgi:hypothetical protein